LGQGLGRVSVLSQCLIVMEIWRDYAILNRGMNPFSVPPLILCCFSLSVSLCLSLSVSLSLSLSVSVSLSVSLSLSLSVSVCLSLSLSVSLCLSLPLSLSLSVSLCLCLSLSLGPWWKRFRYHNLSMEKPSLDILLLV
jgi:hypothetical protein